MSKSTDFVYSKLYKSKMPWYTWNIEQFKQYFTRKAFITSTVLSVMMHLSNSFENTWSELKSNAFVDDCKFPYFLVVFKSMETSLSNSAPSYCNGKISYKLCCVHCAMSTESWTNEQKTKTKKNYYGFEIYLHFRHSCVSLASS